MAAMNEKGPISKPAIALELGLICVSAHTFINELADKWVYDLPGSGLAAASSQSFFPTGFHEASGSN